MLGKKSKNKNETEIIKTLSENQSYKNDVIPKVINDSFDLEKKAQSKHNKEAKNLRINSAKISQKKSLILKS